MNKQAHASSTLQCLPSIDIAAPDHIVVLAVSLNMPDTLMTASEPARRAAMHIPLCL